MTAANAIECSENCLTQPDGEDTNRPPTNAYKMTRPAPSRKLCNNAHTNQEYHWTVTNL